MSCDLSDPAIITAYGQVQSDECLVDWLLLGYKETRDKLFLYSTGTQGVVELQTKLGHEIHWGLVRIQGRTLVITWLPEGSINGVRRARALVHSRAVAAFLPHHATLTAASSSELNMAAVLHKLRLDGSTSVPTSPLINQGSSPKPNGSPSFNGEAPPPLPTKQRPSVGSIAYSPAMSASKTSPNLSDSPTLQEKMAAFRASPLQQQAAQFSPPPRQPLGSYAPPPVSATRSPPTSPPLNGGSFSPQVVPASPAQSNGSQAQSTPATTPGSAQLLSANGVHSTSPHPEDEWRAQDHSRPTSVAQAYDGVASDEDEAELVKETATLEVTEPAAVEAVVAPVHEVELDSAAAQEAERQAREDALEAEREQREQAQVARAAVEREARARWESEQQERARLDAEERHRLELEERDRREAAERLRREEQRRLELLAKAEEERLKAEEAARIEAEEEQRQAREAELVLERKLAEEEAARAKEAEKQRGKDELLERYASAKGDVILSGYLTAQSGGSIYWRRRFFQLEADSLSLYKTDQDLAKPMSVVALAGRVKSIVDSPEEASGVLNSFKLTFKDGDEDDYLFFTDLAEDKELLVVGIKAAARL